MRPGGLLRGHLGDERGLEWRGCSDSLLLREFLRLEVPGSCGWPAVIPPSVGQRPASACLHAASTRRGRLWASIRRPGLVKHRPHHRCLEIGCHRRRLAGSGRGLPGAPRLPHASRHTHRECSTAVRSSPSRVHREHPNAIGAPHEVRGMSEISTSWGLPRRRQRWGETPRASGGAPACGQPRMSRHDPKPSPDLAVARARGGSPRRVPPSSFDREGTTDALERSRASADALPENARRAGAAPWRRPGSGAMTGGARPSRSVVGQTRRRPEVARHSSSRRPPPVLRKGPTGKAPSWPQQVPTCTRLLSGVAKEALQCARDPFARFAPDRALAVA